MAAAGTPEAKPQPFPALTWARGPAGSRQVAKIQAGGRGVRRSCFTSPNPMPRLAPVSNTPTAAIPKAPGRGAPGTASRPCHGVSVRVYSFLSI